MNKLILLICTIFFILGIQTVSAQHKLSLAQQQEDFKIFRTSMQEMHAGLNWFITPDRFQMLYDSVYNLSLVENAETEQFYLKVRYCMAALKHGHDGVNMTDSESGINFKMNALPKSRKHIPFILRFLDKKLYIINNCSNNKAITNGSEITSINGKSVTKLSDEFCQYIFANGKNTTFKYQVLGVYFQFQYLLQVLHPSNEYEVEIIPFGKSKKIKLKVQTELPQTIANAYKEQTGKDIGTWDTLVEYKLLDSTLKLGYLKFETFSAFRIEDDSIKFTSLFEKMFSQIKKDGINNLVTYESIDLLNFDYKNG
ncbi:MAG: hypothetical protein U5M51_05470 [Emticicia sp.]|nr:hypothetical protein [Emticicia sp.]